MEQTRAINVLVNGMELEREVPVRMTLADFLRDRLGLTGTHLGCEQGVCGACTLIVNGQAVRSCLMLAVQADSSTVETVESLAEDEKLSELQQAFLDCSGIQCGFCTPGFLMTATAFLREVPKPTREQVTSALSGNICRCTGYLGVVDAVLKSANSPEGNHEFTG